MPRVRKLVVLAVATALTAGLLLTGGPAADANARKRVKVTGGYGHVVVTDFYWRDGAPHVRHKSVYPGHRSPKSWSVDLARFVGESKCVAWGWWTNPDPDEWQGRSSIVDRNMTFRVTQAYC